MLDPTSSPSQRDRLFACYAANLSAFASSDLDLFVCPLCLRQFDRDSLDRGEITIEHVPPRALGVSSLVTLTCRQCNCQGGTKLDAALINHVDAEDSFSGRSHKPIRGRLTTEHGAMTADFIHYAGDSPEIHML
jgi:hypothetical protein